MKSNINDEYRKILNDLESHIQNKKDLEYAKSSLEKLAMLFINEMEDMTEKYEKKLNQLEENHKKLEQDVNEVKQALSSIEQDIYDGEMNEDTYEFEISCPYCNNDFVAELDDVKDEVQCPECKNIIELDWEHSCEDDGCTGECSCCSGCDEDEEDEDEDM